MGFVCFSEVYTKKFRSKRNYEKLCDSFIERSKPFNLKKEFWLLEAPAVPPYSVILSNLSVIEEYQKISNIFQANGQSQPETREKCVTA